MKVWVDIVFVMGMIGMLIGLVFMFGNMVDFKVIGFVMVVVFLIMFYGVFFVNVLFVLMLIKFEGYFVDEIVYCELVIEGLCGIVKGESGWNI